MSQESSSNNSILDFEEVAKIPEFNLLEIDDKGDSGSIEVLDCEYKVLPPTAFRSRLFVYVKAIRYIKYKKVIKIKDPKEGKEVGWFEITN